MDIINEKIKELKNYINFNKIEESDIDKNKIQKCFFQLMRECIKSGMSTIEVGSYTINIKPEELAVIYDADDTYVEISNKDIHKENLIPMGISYFVINPTEQDEYPITTPAIRATGTISTYDDVYEEIYELVISDDINDDIRNYIILNNGYTYSESEFSDKYNVTVKRTITDKTPYIDIYDILNKNIIHPVTYIPETENYVKRTVDTDKSYKNLIPSLNDKQIITSYLYSLIVDFYTEYMNNQM